MQLNADDRIGAEEALRHRYFSPLPRKLYELPDGEFYFTTLSYRRISVTSTRKEEILLTAENREGIMGSTEQDSKQTGCGKCIMLCILRVCLNVQNYSVWEEVAVFLFSVDFEKIVKKFC